MGRSITLAWLDIAREVVSQIVRHQPNGAATIPAPNIRQQLRISGKAHRAPPDIRRRARPDRAIIAAETTARPVQPRPCSAPRWMLDARKVLTMIDREKVLAVLFKRFPRAPLCDVAAAANAIVGLDPEFNVLPAADLRTFLCETRTGRYGTQHVSTDEIRLYRRSTKPTPGS